MLRLPNQFKRIFFDKCNDIDCIEYRDFVSWLYLIAFLSSLAWSFQTPLSPTTRRYTDNILLSLPHSNPQETALTLAPSCWKFLSILTHAIDDGSHHLSALLLRATSNKRPLLCLLHHLARRPHHRAALEECQCPSLTGTYLRLLFHTNQSSAEDRPNFHSKNFCVAIYASSEREEMKMWILEWWYEVLSTPESQRCVQRRGVEGGGI